MKKIFALLTALLLVAPALAIGDRENSSLTLPIKSKFLKAIGCSTTENLDNQFMLKTFCPREASISGETIEIILKGISKKADGVYSKFTVKIGSTSFDFEEKPKWEPLSVGKYSVTVVLAGVYSVGDFPLSGYTNFIVSKD